MSESIEQLAADFYTAIERGDMDRVRDLYTPQAEVWHNFTRKAQSRDENLELLKSFNGRVSELRIELISRHCFDGGFVQRHVLHATFHSGSRIEVPTCSVVYVVDGKVDRVFEYLDPAAVRTR